MNSATTPEFWRHFHQLPLSVQRLARKNFRLWRENHTHPSLHFKKVGEFWSVRVGDDYRALAYKEGAYMVWVWIGRHDEYQRFEDELELSDEFRAKVDRAKQEIAAGIYSRVRKPDAKA